MIAIGPTLSLITTAALLSAPPAADQRTAAGDTSSPGASWVVTTQLLAGYGALWRGDESANAFDLERAELGLGFDWLGSDRPGRVSAELRLDAVRSVSGQSQFGVDGNALVVRVKRAWFGGGGPVGPVAIDAGAGLIAHPFLERMERGHPFRGGSPTQLERGNFVETADLGAFVGLSAWRGALELGVAVMNGEGYSDVELNDEKDILAWLGSEPWRGTLFGSPASLWLGVAFQDGSVGAGSAANRRVLAGTTFASSRLSTGLEFAYAFGYAGEGGRDASGIGTWVSGELIASWLGLYARYDHLNDDLDADDAVRHRLAVGLYSDLLSGLGAGTGDFAACDVATFGVSNGGPPPSGVLALNEITSSGDDLIELINLGPGPAIVAGHAVSDDGYDPAVPETVPLHHSVLASPAILAAGERIVLVKGTDHVFGLGKSDSVTLWSPDGAALDSTTWVEPDAEMSWCRSPDATGPFGVCSAASPGLHNP